MSVNRTVKVAKMETYCNVAREYFKRLPRKASFGHLRTANLHKSHSNYHYHHSSRAQNLLLHLPNNSLLLKCQATTKAMLTINTSMRNFALRDTRLISAATHVELLGWSCWGNVKVEDIHWKAKSGACVGNIDDTSDVALDGSTG